MSGRVRPLAVVTCLSAVIATAALGLGIAALTVALSRPASTSTTTSSGATTATALCDVSGGLCPGANLTLGGTLAFLGNATATGVATACSAPREFMEGFGTFGDAQCSEPACVHGDDTATIVCLRSEGNSVSDVGATIGGGQDNVVSRTHGTVAGGNFNINDGPYSTIGGGDRNTIGGSLSVISGGKSNEITASASYGSIGGGLSNVVTKAHGRVGGGFHNEANGHYATVVGGTRNVANGDASVVAGNSNECASHYTSCFGVGVTNNVTSQLMNSGNCHCLSYNNPSDMRIKRNITTLNLTDAVAVIQALRPVEYVYDTRVRDDGSGVGFIAQEAAAVDARLAGETPNDITYSRGLAPDAPPSERLDVPHIWAMEKGRLLPFLVGAQQATLARLEALEAAVAAIEAQLAVR